MIEELQGIDTSAIEELGTIKQEQELLTERLRRMEERRQEVSDQVYRRVKTDYEARLSDLDTQASPLKERARREYATLRALYERQEGALETTRLDKEEVEFRHGLGEFTDAEFTARVKELDAAVEKQQADLAEVSSLKQRFVEVFHSEEELEPRDGIGSAPETAPPPNDGPELELEHEPGAPPSIAVPPPMPTVQEATPTSTESAVPPPPFGEDPPPPTSTESGATVVIRGPALTTQAEDGSLEEYSLGREITSIGRSPENDIRIAKSSVSRRHSKIVLEADGYRIHDLGSENGTYVNGERVTECLLRNGDMVQIGPVAFVFTQA